MDGRIKSGHGKESLLCAILAETGDGAMKPAAIVFVGAATLLALVTGASPAAAQTFKSYACADGTQFIVGFFQYDKRAHLQIDGKAVALAKRITLSGARYSGGGIVLKVGKAGTTIRRGRRPASACSVQG
jgi:membrane-bound inhibitor of C-type lysozyme